MSLPFIRSDFMSENPLTVIEAEGILRRIRSGWLFVLTLRAIVICGLNFLWSISKPSERRAFLMLSDSRERSELPEAVFMPIHQRSPKLPKPPTVMSKGLIFMVCMARTAASQFSVSPMNASVRCRFSSLVKLAEELCFFN